MADILIGEIIRVVLSYGSPGASIAQNVFYYELQSQDADPAQLLADYVILIKAGWLNEWKSVSDASCDCFLLEMDIVNGDGTVDRNIGDADPDVQGIGTGEILPAAVAGYMQANTERANSLGRKFVPFLIEDHQVDGFWSSGATGTLADMLAEWLTIFIVDTAADMVPGIVSRVTQTFQEFLGSGYATNVPAYQRRRKPNVGS